MKTAKGQQRLNVELERPKRPNRAKRQTHKRHDGFICPVSCPCPRVRLCPCCPTDVDIIDRIGIIDGIDAIDAIDVIDVID
ncbi:MAG: hypothetical protein II308_09035, partial [Muribaculaceae bacterium]|nr:hypothetical protein [Muribaculaceae bacterium]